MKKKIVLFLAVFFISIFMPNTSVFSQESFPFIGKITGDKVSVRAGQNKNFERLTTLPEGTKITVVSKSYRWYKIVLPQGSNCFISADYVQAVSPQQGVVLGNRVNLRGGSGTQFSVIGQLNAGDQVHIVDASPAWYKIIPPEGTFGWIYEELVAFDSPGQIRRKIVRQPIVVKEKVEKIAKVQVPTESKRVWSPREEIKQEEHSIEPKEEDQNFFKVVKPPQPQVIRRVEKRIEPKVEGPIEQKVEPKVTHKIGWPRIRTVKKIEKKVEKKVEPEAEPKIAQRIEQKVEPKIVQKIEQKVEPKIVQKTEQTVAPKVIQKERGEKAAPKITKKKRQTVQEKIEQEIIPKITKKAKKVDAPPVAEKIEQPAPKVVRKKELVVEEKTAPRVVKKDVQKVELKAEKKDVVLTQQKGVITTISQETTKKVVTVVKRKRPVKKVTKRKKIERIYTLAGIIEKLSEKKQLPDIQYQLILEDHTAYYLRGPQFVFDEFNEFKVRVKGTIRRNRQDQSMSPIITTSLVQLIL